MPSPANQDFLDFVLDQLGGIRRVTGRRMFGAWGLYCGEEFFGILDEGRLYFYADDTTRARYEARGMGPFEYAPGKVLKGYYEVPVDVLEDDAALCEWARESVTMHRRKPRPRGRSAPRGKPASRRTAR